MEHFIEKQRGVYPLLAEDIDILLQNMEVMEFSKGAIVVKEGKRGSDVYFIKNGLARAYVLRDGKDITLWFSGDGDMIANVPGGISSFNIEVLEDSVLLRITQSSLENLFEQSLGLANWGRKLLEHYLSEYDHYFINYSWTNAGEQYEQLIKSDPVLLQKVPLKHIASYLQITPQSLSRIRAKIK